MTTDGTAELVKLTELLRLGLQTVRDIADVRPKDYLLLMEIVERAEVIACDLDKITGENESSIN